MKEKVLTWMYAIETAICTRGVFASFAWLAVAFAFISAIFGVRWAAASCALSLAVLAHTTMAVLTNFGSLTDSFAIIQQVYKRDVANGEKKQPEAAQPESTKIN
jgi:hypothetical protein